MSVIMLARVGVMVLRQVTVLVCDVPECGATSDADTIAGWDGWSHDTETGDDYCPTHTPTTEDDAPTTEDATPLRLVSDVGA